ncbi:MAG TPA: SDR family oxidoreductase [Actinomycetota bacterium]|nr:SDR family oxidoreductase [Actinomycetota bacterium]
MDIRDKVVLLTGASRGLGVDMALEFAAKGSRLALAARSAEGLEETAASIGSGTEVITIPTDVSDLTSLNELVNAVQDKFGHIDVLVNNAGLEQVWDFEAMDPALIKQIVGVNVTGLMWLTRLVLPEMIERRSGHIVNIASTAGLVPVPHNSVYSATKHAVVGFSHSLRMEMLDHGVGVSVVCPGFVNAGMFAEWGRKPPGVSTLNDTKDVARATVDAVVRNRSEVVIDGGPQRIGDVLQALSPSVATLTYKLSGALGYFRDQARINSEKPKG